MDSFDRDLHVSHFVTVLEGLTSGYQEQDAHRLTLAYFAISGLDILNALHLVDAKQVTNWVYHLQILPLDKEDKNGFFYGFQGSSGHIIKDMDGGNFNNGGHLASTYSAISILRIMGDDLAQLDKKVLLKSMKNLQQFDGSFTPLHTGAETDLRFVFCAAAICYMLDDWSGMDVHKALGYIVSCQSYDGGFGLSPGLESHGGATYCAIAALKLMRYITDDPVSKRPTSSVVDLSSVVEWSLRKLTLDGGFQGRSNKASDTCYSFWVGGSLKLLGAHDFYEREAMRCFLFTCQSQYGGFSKWPGMFPDLYHSYYGLCGFSLLEEPGLAPLCYELGITQNAAFHSQITEGIC